MMLKSCGGPSNLSKLALTIKRPVIFIHALRCCEQRRQLLLGENICTNIMRRNAAIEEEVSEYALVLVFPQVTYGILLISLEMR